MYLESLSNVDKTIWVTSKRCIGTEYLLNGNLLIIKQNDVPKLFLLETQTQDIQS